MKIAEWQRLGVSEGVLREPTEEENRLVFWLPGGRDGKVRHWERISNVPGAEVTREDGLCGTPATAVRAVQRDRGLLDNLLGRFRKSGGERTWLLPNGESAEQQGGRQTDLLLVWAEDDTAPFTEDRLKSRWPQARSFQQVGKNLFLVSGIERVLPRPAPAAPEPEAPRDPRREAEQLLEAARRGGDRHKEASALSDLGIFAQRGGDNNGAVSLLDQALAIVRPFGDKAWEADLLGNQGLALLGLGQAERGVELLEQGLALARESGNRFQIKVTLEFLGKAYSSLRQNARALACYEEALALARAVRDRQQEADLLWESAVENAELGQRDQTLARGEEAIAVLKAVGAPHTDLLSNHLESYRQGQSGARLAGAPGNGTAVVSSAWAAGPGPLPGEGQTSGPGLLRMALSAMKSMTKFIGSGTKTVAAPVRQQRLATCGGCEHHTGLRCRVCGCFTSVKTWLPHEQCPIGKWPAVDPNAKKERADQTA